MTKRRTLTTQARSDVQLLDVKGVAAMLGVHPRTVWRLAAAGGIPEPVRLSPQVVRWRLHELEAFLEGLNPRP